MSSATTCGECGAAIPADSPGGFCAQCLLALGLSSKDGGPKSEGGEEKPEGCDQPTHSDEIEDRIALTAPLTQKAGERIGRYRLLEEIGHGGCGVVYMAEQEEPVRRKVALKVIKLGMDTRQVVARFEAERQALALMDHPNIARVLDAGATDTGRPYFVMELVGGIRITDYCDRHHLTTRQRLDLFIQVSHAIQHAHQKGIIHRDIKPSNVLVTTHDGTAVPKVIDFGIAKATQGRLTDQTLFTAFEQFIGTPAYMSPEQAQLGGLDVDTRSDIYSLGVLLYELLTGKTPFDTGELLAGGLDGMRRTIQEREPLTPSNRLIQERLATRSAGSGKSEFRNLKSEIDRDLDWIVMRCLEKDRARRYETANGLARDVERHLNNEPVVARPPGRLYRLQKTVRRNQTVFVAATVVAVVLVTGVVVSTWQAIRATKAKAQALTEKQHAVRTTTVLRWNLYAADMNLVHQAYAAGDLGRARSLLSLHEPGPEQTDLRGFEWYYFRARCQGDQIDTFTSFSSGVKAVAISPDGTRLAAGSFAQGIRIWSLLQRTLEMSFDGGGAIHDVGFSPDGQWLAYCGEAGSLTFRELKTGRTVPLIESGVSRMVLSPQGMLVAFTKGTNLGGGITIAATNNPAVEVWDYGTRKAVFTAPEPSYSLRFSTDGQMLAIVGPDHFVRVWKINPGVLVRTLGPVSIRSPVSFSPDGSRLASGDDAGEIRIWDLGDGRLVRQLRAHEATIWDISYSTNFLVTASTDQSVRLWNVESLAELAVLRGHGGEVWKVAISPDATLLATGGKDGSVRIWSSRQPRADLVPARDVKFWNWPVFSEDGAFLAVGETRGVIVRRIDDGSVVQTLAQAQRPLAFASGDRELRTLGAAGELQFWDWAAGPRQPTATVAAGLTGVRAHALCSRSDLLALGDRDGNIRLWDLRQRSEVRSWKAHGGQITTLAAAPDGLCLASGGVQNEKSLKLWSLPTCALKRELVGHKLGVFGVAFSPDGKLLASASIDDTCRLWDPASGKEIAVLGGHKGGAFSAAFSADGRTLLVGTGDSKVKLWNLATFRDMGTIGAEPGSVFFAGFAPAQPTLATVSFDGGRTNCSLCLLGAAPVRSAAVASSSLHE